MLRFRSVKNVLTVLAVGGLLAGQARAADVRVKIGPVTSDAGEVLIALYDKEAAFLKEAFQATKAPAASRAGGQSLTLVLKNVPPGRYALSAVHDKNGNGQLDRNLMGLPKEALGFSNGAKVRMGPPKFDEAAFLVGQQDLQLELTLD